MPWRSDAAGNKVSPKAAIAPLTQMRTANGSVQAASGAIPRGGGASTRDNQAVSASAANRNNVFTRCSDKYKARPAELLLPTSWKRTRPAPSKASAIRKAKDATAHF